MADRILVIATSTSSEGKRPATASLASIASFYLIRGSSLNWWNGGGDDKVHSSVVAPSPHGVRFSLPADDERLNQHHQEHGHGDHGEIVPHG